MFGFLFKIIIFGGIVAAVFLGFTKYKIDLNSLKSSATQVNISQLGGQVSGILDGLVTQNTKSPVVLGIEITNDSLKTIAETISGLPPDQLSQIKQYICQPATGSAQ